MKVDHHGFVMPNKWTFQIPIIGELLEDICRDKKCLFPFAGVSRISSCESAIYIDVHEKIEWRPAENKYFNVMPTIVGDCKIIMDGWIKEEVIDEFDVVVLDPPYSAHQATRQYGNEIMSDIKIVKDLVAELVKPKGIVVTFAFNSTGMGKIRNFIKDELHIFNHGGNHNDTMMLVEHKRVIPSLDKYLPKPEEEGLIV